MKRILLIDDDDSFRHMLGERLRRSGFTVVEACNGKLASQYLRHSEFDLVITDIIMPEQEGLETIISLRRDFPEIPVIAVSGGGRLDSWNVLQPARTLGARHVFEKPLDWPRLIEAVHDCMGCSQAR